MYDIITFDVQYCCIFALHSDRNEYGIDNFICMVGTRRARALHEIVAQLVLPIAVAQVGMYYNIMYYYFTLCTGEYVPERVDLITTDLINNHV